MFAIVRRLAVVGAALGVGACVATAGAGVAMAQQVTSGQAGVQMAPLSVRHEAGHSVISVTNGGGYVLRAYVDYTQNGTKHELFDAKSLGFTADFDVPDDATDVTMRLDVYGALFPDHTFYTKHWDSLAEGQHRCFKTWGTAFDGYAAEVAC
ncbi:hypothetical protein [Longimycelium tulufanense]|nr:hypothetical protein [Longimycelium tulufanense]